MQILIEVQHQFVQHRSLAWEFSDVMQVSIESDFSYFSLSGQHFFLLFYSIQQKFSISILKTMNRKCKLNSKVMEHKMIFGMGFSSVFIAKKVFFIQRLFKYSFRIPTKE